eukprot:4523056-Pyramimonas_sp.AAC.1
MARNLGELEAGPTDRLCPLRAMLQSMEAIPASGLCPWHGASSQEKALHPFAGLAREENGLGSACRKKPRQFVVRLEAKPWGAFWELNFSDHGFHQRLHVSDMKEGPMTLG